MAHSNGSIRSLLVVAACLTLAPVQAVKTDVPSFAYEQETVGDKDVPAKHRDLFGFDGAAPQLRPGQCKPRPGDKAWPSKREWEAFDEALSGALVKTVPLAAPCFHNWDVYDAEKCEAVTKDWNSPYLHIDDPTSIMWPVWEGRSCLPTDDPDEAACTLGAYPVYAVNATSVAQIQLAVNFARNKGLRLVIKNTGHDYQAKSSGAGSLSVWTHHLRDIEFLEDYKLGQFSGDALHVGAGVLTGDLVKAAHDHDASFVGGMCSSVGFAGGYYSGGGHSPLSSVYGLGADHVLAVNAVTADGRFVTATEKQNSDLFWALRGGGPSTFGVTTSVVVRLQPQMHATSSRISFQTSEDVSDETFWKGAKIFFEMFEDLTKAGVYIPVNILRNSEWYNGSSYSLSARPMLAPKKTEEEFNKLIQPLFDSLKKLGIPYESDTRFFTSYQAAFTDSWPADDLFVASPDDIQASWLFPESVWKDKKAFDKAFKSIRYVSDSGHDVGAFGIAPGNPFKVDNAANPALREAMAFVSTGAVLPENPTAEQLATAQDRVMNDLVQSWRDAAPTNKQGGSYLNEGNVREPDWKQAFYGKHYPRLLRVKEKWDPKGVFYATAGVGSEKWEVRTREQGIQTQNGPLCRV